jgi:CHAT domain-containing protein
MMRLSRHSFLCFAVVLGACQTTESPAPVSLDVARTVTDKIHFNRLNRLPRSVDDVLERMEVIKPGRDPCEVVRRDRRQLWQDTYQGLVDQDTDTPWADAQVLLGQSRIDFAQGNFEAAITSVERVLSALDSYQWHLDMKGGLAAKLALMHGLVGDVDAARAWSRQASGYTAGLSDDAAGAPSVKIIMPATAEAGSAYALGDFDRAVALIDAAEAEVPARHRRFAMKVDPILAEQLAINALVNQRHLGEAEMRIRAAIETFIYPQLQRTWSYPDPVEDGTYSATANYLTSFADILYARGSYAEGEKMAGKAIEMNRVGCSEVASFGYVQARKTFISGLVRQENWPRAMQELEALQRDLQAHPTVREKLLLDFIDWPFTLIMNGRLAEGRRVLSEMVRQLSDNGEVSGPAGREARSLLALAVAMADPAESNVAALRSSIDVIVAGERENIEGDDDRNRSYLVGRILDGYFRIVRQQLRAENSAAKRKVLAEELFYAATLRRLRLLQKVITAAAARNAAKDSELAELIRREQNAGFELNMIRDQLVAAAYYNQGLQTRLQDRARALISARRTLRGEIDRRFPRYSEHLHPTPMQLPRLGEFVAGDEALLFFHLEDQESFVWVVRATGLADFAVVPQGRESIHHLVYRVRRSLDNLATTLSDLPPYDLDAAYEIYQHFLAPVARGWQDAENLLIVGGGDLGLLPFPALPTKAFAGTSRQDGFSHYRDVRWLARSHAVTYVPSLETLRTSSVDAEKTVQREQFVGFGAPVFSPAQALNREDPAATKTRSVRQRGLSREARKLRLREGRQVDLSALPALPETADELKAIARSLGSDPEKTVHLGPQASETAVKRAKLDNVRVLAFATHGLVPGDLNGLTQPSLAMSTPAVTGENNEDGLLTMDEIYALDLNADWVVLSACNTATGDSAGSEALTGLGRAFFYAGARALLATQWSVETTSAKALTVGLFEQQTRNARQSRAKSLQTAMLKMIDGTAQAGSPLATAYSHPFFWAPFVLVGGGG